MAGNVEIRRRANPDKRRSARGSARRSLRPLYALRSLNSLNALRTLRSRRSGGTNQAQRQRESVLGVITIAAPLYFEQKRLLPLSGDPASRTLGADR